MKKKTVTVLVVVLLAATVAVVALDRAGWPGLAPRLAERAGPGVSLDADARLHLLWRPRLEAQQLRVVGAQGETLADAQQVMVAWRWGDLWHWHRGAPLRLRAVQAERLAVSWQRDLQGRTPWPLPPKADGQPRAAPPQLDELVIRNGSATLDDALLQLAGDARFSTAADGVWKADVKGRLRGQQLALTAEAGAGMALLSPADRHTPPVQLRVALSQGPERLNFEGTAASLLDARALDGRLQVRGRSLAAAGRPFGITLPSTPAFDLAGRLRHASGLWQLDDVKAKIGGSRLGGHYAFDTRPARPLLTGTLSGGPLRLADLGPAVGADTPPSRSGRVLPDRPLDLPALHQMNARVNVALSQLDLGTQNLEPLAPVKTNLVLQDGVLTLSQLDAGVAGGQLTGSAGLDTRPVPPVWQASLDVNNLAIERWLTPDAKPLTRHAITGRLKAQLDVKGSGHSTAELLASLDGPLQMRLENGSVSHLLTEAAGLDVAQGLGLLIKGDSNLPLNCARLDGRFAAGVLRPRTAIVDNRDSRLDVDGRLSLKDETLDLRVVARPKDFSPLTLRAPVRVQGTLADPRIALEGRQLGGRAVAALALGALAPPAALLAFVDPGEKLPPVDCSLQNRTPQPASAR